MKKAPSVRELSEKRTEGEKPALFKTLDKGNALSPTRFAGAPSQRGPSPLLHTVKGEGAQELLRALCLGVVEERLRRALLDDFAAV